MDNEIEIVDELDDKKVIEQKIYVPELENGLVRMDMNIIEYPLFTKNRRIKPNVRVRFVINDNRNKTIEVIPAADEVVPGEFEKAVFISLSKIMKFNGYKNTFVTTSSEILKNMDITASSQRSLYKNVKIALERLGKTSYVFNNTLYSSKEKNLITSKIVTKILEVQVITKINKKDIEEYSKLTEDQKKMQENYFNDGRVKEVFVISFGNYFYQNIVSKGYLVYSASQLLGLRSNGTALDLYMLLTKARMYDLVYRENFLKLAGRVGIKTSKKSYTRNCKTISDAAEVLLEKKLITDFSFHKNGGWSTAYFEFKFSEEHNKIKQDNFMEDKLAFGDIVISQHDELDIDIKELTSKPEELKINSVTQEEIEYSISQLPYSLKRLKTIKFFLEKSIARYGFKRVLQAIEYTKQNAKIKPKSFLEKAIEFNYGSKIEMSLPKEALLSKIKENNNEVKLNIEIAFDKFMGLDPKKQTSILQQAIEETLNETLKLNKNINDEIKENIKLGIESNFKTQPDKYLAEWLVEKNFFDKDNIESKTEKESNFNILMKKLEEKKNEFKKESIQQQSLFSTKKLSEPIIKETVKNSDTVDIKEIKVYINNSINLYADILDLNEENISKLKKDIAKKILPLAMNNKLTKEKLNELIQIELDKI